MRDSRKWIFRSVVALVALLVCPPPGAEVGVVVNPETTTLQSGPYVAGIIENADPISAMVWTRLMASSGTRVLLNEDGLTHGDGRPSVTQNPISNLPIVTWGKNNGSGFDVVESHFENGAWTTPAIIASGVTATLDPEPTIVVDRQTGTVHVVYFCDDVSPRVMHLEATADLSSWAPAVQVSPIAEYALRPSAVVHQGTLRIAYEVHGSSVGSIPRQIAVATSDGLGGFSYESVTSTHFGEANRPQLHAGMGDTLWIDWIDGNNDLAWSEWNSSTSWGGVQLESFTDPGDRDFHARSRIKQLATQ